MRLLIAPLEGIYGGIIYIRNLFFDKGIFSTSTIPVPVISVGNITAGGAGKSPMVDYIVKYLLSRGITPAIISRGYGRSTKGVQLVSDGKHLLLDSRQAGDEVVMLARKNPQAIVVVAEKRVAGARFIMKRFKNRLPGAIVLDDGFQHRWIHRDLDILLINAQEPFESNRLLPAGTLREPASCMKRADIVIISKVDPEHTGSSPTELAEQYAIVSARAGIRPGRLIRIERDGNRSCPPGETGTLRFLAFAGIAGPAGFQRTLEECGMDVASTVWFRDHEPYSTESVHSIIKKAREKNLALVTTEKDYVRLLGTPELHEALAEYGSYYLTIEPDILEGREKLEDMIDRVLK
ncbi:tetraacyldisaccharide 4'-kinase [Prosthecochloris sp. HL-130-GSB]|nr:tetraacyldisaccharide 4'-kinase [Prosthecochloris sp. HL-130-GSB]MBO8091991.1 tetraacyldisaccharide 4'-kinase [Prosthecochloris sp.]